MTSLMKSAVALGNIGRSIITYPGKCNSACSLTTRLNACFSSAQLRCYSATYFTKKHEYIRLEADGAVGIVGISDYAQEKLGDVVYVQLPEVGVDVKIDDEVAAVESVKAASEIYSPVSGSITEINESLESDCGLINKSAMDHGWIYKLKLANKDEVTSLMTQSDYDKYLEEENENEH